MNMDPESNGTIKQSAFNEVSESSKEDEPPPFQYEVQSSWSVFRQMLPTFILAGFGSVFAGIVLHRIIEWDVFKAIPQFEIMISAFIGLIGNIETTYASRMSTQANLGKLDSWAGIRQVYLANFLVVQCQASTAGLFASLMALLMSTFQESTRATISWENTLLLCATSVITSMIANTLLALVIGAVIYGSRKFGLNPDNIATPVAASMGDVCTLLILAPISEAMYQARNYTLEIVILTLLIASSPVFGYFARRQKYSRSVIFTGWFPLLGGVMLVVPGGLVMEAAFAKFKVISTFQPLVNGIGHNLIGIQTSRMSTFLHSVTKKGVLPDSNPRYCVGPFWVFASRDIHSRMARLLLFVIVPAHLFFMTVIYFMQNSFHFAVIITFPFVACYVAAVVMQLLILLYVAYVGVFFAWQRRINPDNSAIPVTSALADVLGNCLMAAVFLFLEAIGDPNANLTS